MHGSFQMRSNIIAMADKTEWLITSIWTIDRALFYKTQEKNCSNMLTERVSKDREFSRRHSV